MTQARSLSTLWPSTNAIGVVVAVSGRWEAVLGDDAGAARVEHGEGDPVPVGIDADHMVDEFCEHGGGTSV